MTNEELLEKFRDTLPGFERACMGDDCHTHPGFDASDAVAAYMQARAAVLARMAGPGEVVVPVKPTPAMRDAMRLASRRDVPSDEMCDVRYAALLAARPNNGGDDDASK